MRRQAYKVMAMLMLLGSLAVVAQAQSQSGTRLTASIPFQFNVGNETLPAGEYAITTSNPASDQAILQLRRNDGRASVQVQMIAAIAQSEQGSRLIFNRYGNKYFFAQVWVEGDANGLQAPKARGERNIRRELSGLRVLQEAVALTTSR